MEVERCIDCDNPTGRSGEAEDSIYTPGGRGPFCIRCFEEGVAIDLRAAQIQSLKATIEALQGLEKAQRTANLAVAELVAGLALMESDENLGCGLISDDFGNWAVSGCGFQNVTDDEDNVPTKEKPIDIQSTFFVEADEWRGSTIEALRAFIDAGKASD